MLDFTKWQMINESLTGAGFSLGLGKPQTLGGLIGKFQYLDEKKKHMSKDVEKDELDAEEADDENLDDDMGEDEEDAEECGPKFCNGKKMMKKKMKNECDCDDKKKPVEMDADADGDEDMGDEDVDGEEDGEGAEGDEDIAFSGSKDKKVPLGFMKKKMAKKMKKESVEDFMSNLSSSYTPKPTADDDFWTSISGHHYDFNKKFSDGFSEYKEDYLISPEAPVAQAETEQPKPGEVGFAPQQRIDTGLGYDLPPLDESKKPTQSWWM
jgi:hypothetical protein